MTGSENWNFDVRGYGAARHREAEEDPNPMTAPEAQPQSSPEDNYASLEEAAEAIVGLSSKDLATLQKLARSYWEDRMSGPNAASDPEDLFQEAIVRTLRGKRRWRRSVTIIKHLVRTMESISWDALRARRAQPHAWTKETVEDIDPGDHDDDSDASVVVDVVLAREELARIEALFEYDQEALEVLQCRSLGLLPSETCARLSIERSRYDTVSKRIWRKLTKSAENNHREERQ